MQCVIGMRPTKYFYVNMSQDVVTSDSDDDNDDDRPQILSVKIFSAHLQKTLFILFVPTENSTSWLTNTNNLPGVPKKFLGLI